MSKIFPFLESFGPPKKKVSMGDLLTLKGIDAGVPVEVEDEGINVQVNPVLPGGCAILAPPGEPLLIIVNGEPRPNPRCVYLHNVGDGKDG